MQSEQTQLAKQKAPTKCSKQTTQTQHDTISALEKKRNKLQHNKRA